MQGEQARFGFTDFPYNLAASDISGNGQFKHENFVMAAGELTPAQYTRF
jgi:hypothetical protein